MPVTMVAAKDLELIALREIRSFPGAEYVCHVEVEPAGSDWAITTIARDGADLDRIQYAVSLTTKRLKQRYAVRFDW
ncbi:hypothetical protein ACVIWU_006771 [Bradyrhizobium sp. USDA 4509]